MMATDPLDIPGLLRAAGGDRWAGMPAGTVMGHVHLHVGHIPEGMAFFSDALGFDRTVLPSIIPARSFPAPGGYHHHLGTNNWAGANATAPARDEAQLLEWTIQLPDAASLAAAGESLVRAGYGADASDSSDSGGSDGSGGSASILTSDPWGTHVRLVVTPPVAPVV